MNTCPICKTMFEPTVPHQAYDRLSCRKMAERQRARLRDKGVQIQTRTHYGAADHATVLFRSADDLEQIATVYLNNPKALQTHVFNVPKDISWAPPDGVTFCEQWGTEPRYWLLCATELITGAQARPTESFERPRQHTTLAEMEAILNKIENKNETPIPQSVVTPRTDEAAANTPNA